jgi:predicted amidohydrolase
MVVAGSFHFIDPEDNLRYNVSRVLDHNGNILWQHKKMQKYTLNELNINKKPALIELLKISCKGGKEGIYLSDKLICADTPIGRIAVCICIDFFHPEMLALLMNSGITVLFVPAMTEKNHRFISKAEIFSADCLISTFFANSAFIAEKDKTAGKKIAKTGACFFMIPCQKKSIAYLKSGKKGLNDLLVHTIHNKLNKYNT